MTVWALFLRQQSGYGGFENEILKKMTAAAGTSATVIFFSEKRMDDQWQKEDCFYFRFLSYLFTVLSLLTAVISPYT